MMITLILGGARSGKSRHAEELAKHAEQTGRHIVYVATAQACDDEMAQRITRHQSERPNHWQTIEESHHLAQVLGQFDDKNTLILVDCLTLWLSNLLCLNDEQKFKQYKVQFLHALTQTHAEVILVSNETGLGVVPMGQLTRQFVDESGFLHQQIAKLADNVVFCVAGLPMVLKSK